jgi:hypothetical protein
MNDFSHEIVFAVPIVFILTTAAVIIALFNYRLKKQILESGRTDNELLKFLPVSTKNKEEVLKWGLIFFFGGIGLIVNSYLSYPENAVLPFGVEAVFISFGLLVYYFLVKRDDRKGLD